MNTQFFYFVEDIEEMLKVGESKAYEIIKCFNEELEAKGFFTVKGRVLCSYFRQRIGLAA